MSNNDFEIMKLQKWFSKIEAKKGLGMKLYETVSQLVPSVSVDLIIEHVSSGEKLLTWRDDKFYGPGWHIPGGVVRFKEKMSNRIDAVLTSEIGASALTVSGVIGIHEIFNLERDIRGHFISIVYKVTLDGEPRPEKCAGQKPKNGEWRWFSHAPHDLIHNQEQLKIYL